MLWFVALFPAAAAWTYFVAFAGTDAMQPLYGASKAIQFGFPAAWLLLAEGWRPRPAGWHPRGWRAGTVSGLALAAVLFAAWSVLAAWTSLLAGVSIGIRDQVAAVGLGDPGRFLAFALFLSLIHSFLEEYYWRWFLYGRLRRRWGRSAALPAAGLAFAAHHAILLNAFLGPGLWWGTALGTAAVAAAGILWALQYEKTGSLAGPWISHAIVDLALFLIGFRLIGS